jgi:hypothetical protein
LPEDEAKNLARKNYIKLTTEIAKLSFVEEDKVLKDLVTKINSHIEKRVKEGNSNNDEIVMTGPTIRGIGEYINILLKKEELYCYAIPINNRVYPLIKKYTITYLPEDTQDIPGLEAKIKELKSEKQTKTSYRHNTTQILELLSKIQQDGRYSKHKKNVEANMEAYEIGRRVSLPPQIRADKVAIIKSLIEKGIVSSNKKPQSYNKILNSADNIIIRYYSSLGNGLLSYYRCCDNLNAVKNIVLYYLRFSLLKTLADKHKLRSIKTALVEYGEKITAEDHKKKRISFLDLLEISNMKKEFLINITDYHEVMKRTFISFNNQAIYGTECAIKGCLNTKEIEIHHVRKLFRDLYFDSSNKQVMAVKDKKGKILTGQKALDSALKRKQIPLCKEHHNL